MQSPDTGIISVSVLLSTSIISQTSLSLSFEMSHICPFLPASTAAPQIHPGSQPRTLELVFLLLLSLCNPVTTFQGTLQKPLISPHCLSIKSHPHFFTRHSNLPFPSSTIPFPALSSGTFLYIFWALAKSNSLSCT